MPVVALVYCGERDELRAKVTVGYNSLYFISSSFDTFDSSGILFMVFILSTHDLHIL